MVCPNIDLLNVDADDNEIFNFEEDDDAKINPFLDVNNKYLAEKDLDKFFNFNDSKAINMLHINIRSMKKNFCQLEALLSTMSDSVSAIAITETWLTESSKDAYFIPNYKFTSSSRSGKIGGGVGIYVHSSYEFAVREELEPYD